MGNAGVGSASHLCGMLFMSETKVQITTVPYRGTGPVMNDLIGKQIDLSCDQATNTTGPILGKQVKGYAVTTKTRLKSLPDLPTADEAGLKGFELGVWHGLFAPKGCRRRSWRSFRRALRAALKDPDGQALQRHQHRSDAGRPGDARGGRANAAERDRPLGADHQGLRPIRGLAAAFCTCLVTAVLRYGTTKPERSEERPCRFHAARCSPRSPPTPLASLAAARGLRRLSRQADPLDLCRSPPAATPISWRGCGRGHVAVARPADRGREPRRRRRQPRRRAGRDLAARRLHAAGRLERPADRQSVRAGQARLRSAQGFRRGRPRQPRAARDRAAQLGAGEDAWRSWSRCRRSSRSRSAPPASAAPRI